MRLFGRVDCTEMDWGWRKEKEVVLLCRGSLVVLGKVVFWSVLGLMQLHLRILGFDFDSIAKLQLF